MSRCEEIESTCCCRLEGWVKVVFCDSCGVGVWIDWIASSEGGVGWPVGSNGSWGDVQ